jgi:thiol-disulfide isomerase/thioredoxin
MKALIMKAALALVVLGLAGAVGDELDVLPKGKNMVQSVAPLNSPVRLEGTLPSLAGATAWLNSPPLTAASLRGKVVLVDFWTYSCINWRRSAPYVRAWADKYKSAGLVVIGVHSPEFDFEKNVENVRRGTGEARIGYPVAVDSEHAIWRAFGNEYWPALYFVDARGRIRHHQFGEGGYAEAEEVLQRLLTEAGAQNVSDTLVSVEARGVEAAADWSNLRSPENYLGYDRTQNLASPGGATRDMPRSYTMPARLNLNQWALAGEWTARSQAIVLNKPDGRIAYRFHARDLHVVMGPGLREKPVRFRVSIDGLPPGTAHGVDVDSQGIGTATHLKLYQLVRQQAPIADRQFQIEFLDPGVEAFAFTFG